VSNDLKEKFSEPFVICCFLLYVTDTDTASKKAFFEQEIQKQKPKELGKKGWTVSPAGTAKYGSHQKWAKKVNEFCSQIAIKRKRSQKVVVDASGVCVCFADYLRSTTPTSKENQ
jgi:hypothetical protein